MKTWSEPSSREKFVRRDISFSIDRRVSVGEIATSKQRRSIIQIFES